jgi:hypothetical protein
MKNDRAIYALYSKGSFVSWLYGAFCQLSPEPKFYWCGENHQKQSEVILDNLRYKLSKIGEKHPFGDALFETTGNPIAHIIINDHDRESTILKILSDFSLGVFFVNESEVNTELLAELAKTQPDVVFEVNS